MANAQDYSGNNNHGTAHGATLTQDRFGNNNHAYYFNGISDQLEIPSHPTLNPTTQLTITLWMKSYSAPINYDAVFQKGGVHQDATPWGIEREYVLWYHVNQYIQPCSGGDNLGQHFWESSLPQTNNWVFISQVIDRTAAHSFKTQINGVLKTSQTDSYSTFNNNNNPIWLGKGQSEGTSWGKQNGAIDDFRVQTKALSLAEITELQNEPNPGPICASTEYRDGLLCKPCNISCTKCNVTANNCTSCLANNYILNFVCQAVCPDSQQQNSIYCSSCNSSCKTCSNSENTCTTCLQNNGLLNNICYINCPDGQYQENVLCKDCNNSCSKCNVSANNCTACKANTYFLNNSCQNSCPTGQFINGIICSLCNTSCKTCNVSENNCTSCYPLSGLLLNVCHSQCPTGQQFSSELCLKCNNSCATCEIIENNCTSCLPSNGLLNSICYSICPNKQYLQSPSCLQCNASCQNCSISEHFCTSCLSGLGFLDNKCYSICPDGYQMNSLSCSKCNNSCKTCTEITNKCTSCNLGNGILINTCYSICPDKYFLNNSNCSQCNSSCATCQLLADNCTTCFSGFGFLNNKCYSTCPNGYQMNGLSCSKCNNSCQTCSETQNNCTSCNADNGILINTCQAICPDKYFLNNSECSLCNISCGTCELLANNCTTCLSGNGFLNNSCQSICPGGQYMNGLLCSKCNNSCESCIEIADKCTSCNKGNWILNNTCYYVCPAKYYLNKSNCSNCNTTCGTCEFEENNCTSCLSDYGLLNSYCYLPCPNGQFLMDNHCEKCNETCAICSIARNTCTKCKGQYGLLNNSCYLPCPNGYFLNGSFCSTCNSSCKECENRAENCTLCQQSSALLNNSCQENCPEGYQKNASVCLKCNAACKACVNNQFNCTNCSMNLGLLNGSCQSECPESYYLQSSNCMKCNANCKTCYSNESNCTSCDVGLGLLNGKCIIPCLEGYFLSNGLCLECNTKCSTCYGPSENDCRKNIQVSIQLMATIDPLIFRVLLSEDFPEFFKQFDNITWIVKIDRVTNYTYAISKDNNTNDIQIVLLMNQKLNGSEKLNLTIQTPVELDLDPVQILGSKNTSIQLLKYFPTTISEETANLISNTTKITSLVTAGADTVTDLLLTFNSVPILAVGLSRLISQSKFLHLAFPTNVIVCFQKQMEEKTFWRFLDIKQNANESWIPTVSKFRQFNFSPLSWNNTNDAFFKIVIYLICYIALIFLNSSKKDASIPNAKQKKEKPLWQQIQLFFYKLINITTFSYFIVLVIAMLVNFYYVSFDNPGAIISFVIALILYWITMRTFFFSFMVHYWQQSSMKTNNEHTLDSKKIEKNCKNIITTGSSFTKIIHFILLTPTKEEFLAETFKQEFLYFDYKPDTLIGFLYETISFVRYLLFATLLILCEDNPLPTIASSLIISIVIFIWIIIVRPFRNLILIIQYVFLELLALAFFSMLLALWIMDFANQENPNGRVLFGSAFLFLNLLLQLVPTGLLLISSLWEGVQLIKGQIEKRKKQKKINSKSTKTLGKLKGKKQIQLKNGSTFSKKPSKNLASSLFQKKNKIEEKWLEETAIPSFKAKTRGKPAFGKIQTMRQLQNSNTQLKSLKTIGKLKSMKTNKKHSLIKSLSIKHPKPHNGAY